MVTFTGGDVFTARLAELAKRVTTAASVEVGYPAGATREDGTSLALVAAVQEFGAPAKGIPPRPFFRSAIARHSGEWGDTLARELQAADFDAAKALARLGDKMRGDLQQSIVDLTSPALSPVTVMLRGMRAQARYRDRPFGELISEAVRRVAAGKTNYGASTKPLEDTGQLLQGVVSIVKE